MDFLSQVLFENSLYTYLALAFGELILAAVWYERRTRLLGLLLIVPLVLAGVVFSLSAMVTTDRERIVHAAEAIVVDLQAGRRTALQTYLDDGFVGVYSGSRLDKPAAVKACFFEKQRYGITELSVVHTDVEVSGEKATMTAEVKMTMRATELGPVKTKVIFNLTWFKTAQGWRIIEAAEPKVSRF